MIVVKGYDAIFGFTFVIDFISVDFHALGIQIIQISATSFNSNCTVFSSHTSHISAKAGACLVEDAKWAFQNHPLHHEQSTKVSHGVERS